MYLKQSKSGGRIYLSLVESYRDNTGKPRQRTVEKLGYLDDLQKQYPDPVQHFKQIASERTAQKNKDIVYNLPVTVNLSQPFKASDCEVSYNIGYLFPKLIYLQLDIPSFWQTIQRKYRIKYSLNDIFLFLVLSRIVDPRSKRASFMRRANFLEGSSWNFSIDDVYKSMDIFWKYKEDLELHLWKASREKYHRSVSTVYYDCTNYYFEIEENDEDRLDENGDIISVGLRKRGPEKNHRPDPIIGMGLLMDETGIPLAYDIFPGNMSEKLTLRPAVNRIRRDFDTGRVIVVADRGLNTSDNIFFLAGINDEKNGFDGYIYGQSIRNGDKSLKDWALDQNGYVNETVPETTEEDGVVTDEKVIFRHKSRIRVKEITIEKANGVRSHKVKVYVKEMVYYSAKYARKQARDRDKMLKKAEEMLDNRSAYTHATSYGAAGYVKDLKFSQETGEILDSQLSLDTAKAEEEARYDGYYALITSELEMPDLEMRNRYRGLERIENTFKLSKSEIKTRPVFIWNPDRIKSHFLICFTALVIIRLLEARTEYKIPAGRILDAVRSLIAAPFDQNLYRLTVRDSSTVEDIDQLIKALEITELYTFMTKSRLRRLFKY